MKKTFRELREIDAIVAHLYKEMPTLEKTKFGWAYSRFCKKNYVPTLEKYNEKLSDIYIDNALIDKSTKEVLIDLLNPRGFKFGKEELKKVVELEREVAKEFDLKEVEIEPYLSSYIPEGLSEEQIEILTDCIIKN